MSFYRHYTFLDKLCLGVDQVVRALMDTAKTTGAEYPGKNTREEDLSEEQRKHSAGLMRVNHTGEICAQALYHGQGVVSRSTDVQEKMHQAAIEEGDHLAWCRRRLDELSSHPSYLNPLWYAGSFCIGMIAGTIGDKWSLGFVAETERQVIKHLEKHLHSLPIQDQRSYKILEMMEIDEAKHRDEAIALGAKELPNFIKKSMALTSKVMVKTAYWI
ncbi:MAG: 2-polyprenyl-3-methyl-6-methoxy-1,4-benzoquinone monooxygenase [Gammaproteobacteria bacterium]|nr:2-polyprenyl-3-methyl-6-methoxy-1,4-benzoquinone monooxygenase [Gammaproteobacteria bacterium]MCW5583732.1 2-polyprenyl-3-methyl-6-methoxy-1,4-benzoquinone monooxygenase [Gammaproteobacteria bacterium]